MLKLIVVDRFRDRQDTRFGSARELAEHLANRYSEVLYQTPLKLEAQVAALNDSDQFEAKVVPYEDALDANRLPDGYAEASEKSAPDPWPRRGEPAE